MRTSRELVWSLPKLKPKGKLLLLVLLDHTDISDTCSLPLPEVVKKTGIPPSVVIRYLQYLEDMGVIELIGRHITFCSHQIERLANATN